MAIGHGAKELWTGFPKTMSKEEASLLRLFLLGNFGHRDAKVSSNCGGWCCTLNLLAARLFKGTHN